MWQCHSNQDTLRVPRQYIHSMGGSQSQDQFDWSGYDRCVGSVQKARYIGSVPVKVESGADVSEAAIRRVLGTFLYRCYLVSLSWPRLLFFASLGTPPSPPIHALARAHTLSHARARAHTHIHPPTPTPPRTQHRATHGTRQCLPLSGLSACRCHPCHPGSLLCACVGEQFQTAEARPLHLAPQFFTPCRLLWLFCLSRHTPHATRHTPHAAPLIMHRARGRYPQRDGARADRWHHRNQ